MSDLISRQAAIDIIEDFPHGDVWNVESMEEMVDRIKQLPPVQPKRGKWENIVDGIEYTWGTCDACDARFPMPYKYYKYCPHCGAKMEVTE